jgi:hypothetical protein
MVRSPCSRRANRKIAELPSRCAPRTVALCSCPTANVHGSIKSAARAFQEQLGPRHVDSLQPPFSLIRRERETTWHPWNLSWQGVTAAIVGARTPEQVDGWIGGASVQLTPLDLDEIASAIQGTRAGSGPGRPNQVSPSRKTAA